MAHRAETMTEPAADGEALARLEQYLDAFRVAFRRQDQLRRAAAYLLGLLRCPGRKNVENLARAVTLPEGWTVSDVAQALQHFVNQSPWDDDGVLRLHLRRMAAGEPEKGPLVVSEQTYVKQGRHSVGVQRQYSSVLGRKVNCQLAVALHHVGPTSFVPLGVRLYLPRGWAQDRVRLESAGVPPEQAQASKARIALELIERALAEGWTARGVAVGPSAGLGEEFREGLRKLGLDSLGPVAANLGVVLTEGERRLLGELGLDHFEGRSWRGFHHHACLVLLAHHYAGLEPVD
jgi:SRSO17 transposase